MARLNDPLPASPTEAGLAGVERRTRARNETPPETRCRFCGSPDLREIATVAGFRFVECGDCRFTFTPAVTQEGMDALYLSGYHGPEEGAPDIGWADASFLEPALELLGREQRLRVLDFGTGQSVIPDLLRSQGHRVVAVDLSPPIRPHPDRLTGCLLSMHLAPEQYDLAFAFQVFEHLPEPRPFLAELLRLVRPGGLVLVHTDMEMPERGQGFENWWYVLPPDHCSFYRHRTFEVFVAGTPHRILWRDPKCVVIEKRRETATLTQETPDSR